MLVPAVDRACEEPASEAGAKLKNVRGLDEPIAQMGLPEKLVNVTEETR